MSQLKSITAAGVPAALQKAERYRLLNDSTAAESICLDVLAVAPDDQQALVTLLLAITDQFPDSGDAELGRARGIAARLTDEYRRAYYEGIICERRGKAHLRSHSPGAADVAREWFRKAMQWYETAESMRPAGNDEAILRWNTCVRMLERHTRPATAEEFEPALGE